MKLSTFLQLFLLVDVFLIGALSATALRHAYAHFRPAKHESEKSHSPEDEAHLPAAVKQRLLQESQVKFQAALDHSATQLQQDLEATTTRINKLLEQLSTAVVGNELEHYRTELIDLRKQAETNIGAIRSGITEHEAELKAQMAQEIEAEKLLLIKQIDTKLADAVGSFLVETLQHDIDLGAQKAYLTAMLEEHKADFAKKVSDET